MSSGSALKKTIRKKLSLSQDEFIFTRAPRLRKTQKLEDTQKVFKYIDDNIIGKGILFLGPYGRRKGEKLELFFVVSFSVFTTIENCITAHFMRTFQKKNDSLSCKKKNISVMQKFMQLIILTR